MQDNLKKVVWAEGVLLGQQHFQQWDGYWQNVQRMLHHSIVPFPWGASELQINHDNLSRGLFTIQHCRIIYSSGMLINHHEASGQELTCELPTDNSGKFAIYLCIADNQHVFGVAGYDKGVKDFSYEAVYEDVADIYDANRKREVMFGKLNISLELSEKPLHSCIKVAELYFGGDSKFHLVENFIPSVMHVGISPVLLDIARRTRDDVRAKINVLSQSSVKQDNVLLLLAQQALSGCLVHLQHIIQHHRTHPEKLFLVLADLIGRLRICVSEKEPAGKFPNYNHEDLTTSFQNLSDWLNKMLHGVTPIRETGVHLHKESDTLYLASSIDAALFNNANFFIGAHLQEDSVEWIDQFVRQIKVGAKGVIDKLVSSALPGVKISHMQRTPNNLLVKPGFEYFYLEPSGNFWEQIKEERNLAIFTPHRLLNAEIELVTLPKR